MELSEHLTRTPVMNIVQNCVFDLPAFFSESPAIKIVNFGSTLVIWFCGNTVIAYKFSDQKIVIRKDNFVGMYEAVNEHIRQLARTTKVKPVSVVKFREMWKAGINAVILTSDIEQLVRDKIANENKTWKENENTRQIKQRRRKIRVGNENFDLQKQ
jgi:hypothetical protein